MNRPPLRIIARLLVAAVLALGFWIVAASAVPASTIHQEPEKSQDDDKSARKQEKRASGRKQRGKVVSATVVSPAPSATTSSSVSSQAPSESEPAAMPKPGPATPTPSPTTSSAAPPSARPPTSSPAAPQPTAVESVVPRTAPAPAAAPAGVAPTPRPDVVSERIVVSEVLLDVLVTDGKGNVIEGLGPDDFVVSENGEARPVASVTFYGDSSELRGSGSGGQRRSDRYFLLFFHHQAQAAPELLPAQFDTGRRAQRWVQEELLPNDQVAVMGYGVRLKVYLDFTRDRTLAVEAIKRAAVGRDEADRGWRNSEPPAAADSPSLFVNLPQGKDLARQTRRIEQALELVGRAAEGIVGRKNLLLFSLGFGDILTGGEWSPDPRYYPDMKESLNTGNVAVYSIDLLGSERGSPSERRINDALSSISSDTGGKYYWLFTNASAALRQVADDNVGYYLLSYRSEFERGVAGYREVDIETRDQSLNVRARRGYRYGEAPLAP